MGPTTTLLLLAEIDGKPELTTEEAVVVVVRLVDEVEASEEVVTSLVVVLLIAAELVEMGRDTEPVVGGEVLFPVPFVAEGGPPAGAPPAHTPFHAAIPGLGYCTPLTTVISWHC